ncbi:MAG: esterase family protein [Myxococcales bacterium]|nr:esterase family protein [Myxococcales bacterium]
MHGRVLTIPVPGRCLEGNPLGDPAQREVYAYLPPGYESSARRYPTIWLLAGFGATHRSMLGFDPWKPNTVEAFDAQIAASEAAPAILILPDASNRWGGSQFLDSEATGRYQTYLAEEVLEIVDANLRTIPERGGRAVIGRSSGGFGALRLGMDRPDLFSILGSHAGDAAFEISMRPMLTSAAIAFDRAGGVEAFAARLRSSGPGDGIDFDGAFILAASAAYAPDRSERLPYAALPFDPRSAELRPEVWGRWLEHDPLLRIEGAADALRSMRLVFLDAGDRDEHGLQFAARRMFAAMQAQGVAVRHQEFPGGHRGTSMRYETSLPILAGALDA